MPPHLPSSLDEAPEKYMVQTDCRSVAGTFQHAGVRVLRAAKQHLKSATKGASQLVDSTSGLRSVRSMITVCSPVQPAHAAHRRMLFSKQECFSWHALGDTLVATAPWKQARSVFCTWALDTGGCTAACRQPGGRNGAQKDHDAPTGAYRPTVEHAHDALLPLMAFTLACAHQKGEK